MSAARDAGGALVAAAQGVVSHRDTNPVKVMWLLTVVGLTQHTTKKMWNGLMFLLLLLGALLLYIGASTVLARMGPGGGTEAIESTASGSMCISQLGHCEPNIMLTSRGSTQSKSNVQTASLRDEALETIERVNAVLREATNTAKENAYEYIQPRKNKSNNSIVNVSQPRTRT